MPYIQLAAALQSLPEQERVGWLREWARDSQNDWKIICLCRMLFEPRAGKFLRAPRLGAGIVTLDSTPAANWPDWPLAFENGVPFCIIEEDASDGAIAAKPYAGESGASYLEYCLATAQWTSLRYGPPDSAKLDDALTVLLKSPRWGKNPPDDIIERKLAEQISCTCGLERREIPVAP